MAATLRELAQNNPKVDKRKRNLVRTWLNGLSEDDRNFAEELLRDEDYGTYNLLALFRQYGYPGTSRDPLRSYRQEIKLQEAAK